jgi:hypothetical protein
VDTAATHESFAALVCPRHDFPNRFIGFGQTVQESNKFDFQQLDEFLVTAIANQSGLIADRLKINLFPGSSHIGKLLGIGEDGIQGLGYLVYIKETHFGK